MRRLLWALTLAAALPTPAFSAQGATGNGTSPIICDATVAKCANVVTMPNGLNAPVVAPFVGSLGSIQAIACDKSVSVNITTATTTEVVLVSDSLSIYVCGYFNSKSSGAGSTYQFVYGTKTTTGCDTGQTAITPAMDGNALIEAFGGSIGSIFHTPAAKELCIVTVGGGSSFIGFIVYAQF